MDAGSKERDRSAVRGQSRGSDHRIRVVARDGAAAGKSDGGAVILERVVRDPDAAAEGRDVHAGDVPDDDVVVGIDEGDGTHQQRGAVRLGDHRIRDAAGHVRTAEFDTVRGEAVDARTVDLKLEFAAAVEDLDAAGQIGHQRVAQMQAAAAAFVHADAAAGEGGDPYVVEQHAISGGDAHPVVAERPLDEQVSY